MPKVKMTLKVPLVAIVIVFAVVATIGLSISLSNLLSGSAEESETSTCDSGRYTTHRVVIKNNVVKPLKTIAQLCDKLIITNQDPNIRLIAFGEHDNHMTYDGVVEKPLRQDQSLSVTLNKSGDFKFHDHIHDELQGTFQVNDVPQ